MKNIKCKLKKNNAITLISLVITIIIIIILVGVAINLSLGENGLFSKAKYAKEETNKQAATEKINLKITSCQINTYSERQEMPTLKELSIALKDDKEIDYVTEKSQIASTKYEVGEEPTSIFTKLKEYPYEFEINGKLQLASINGIKIASNNSQNIPNDNILYDISNYSSDGLEVYDSRFKDIQGGYMIDGDMVYVYIVAFTNKALNWIGATTMCVSGSLPNSIEIEPVQATSEYGRIIGGHIGKEGVINLILNEVMPANEKIVIRGKYKMQK